MRCDVIIPVWNQLAFTKDCIESVKSNTRVKYRLIIIDNASDSETKQYLENLHKRFPEKIIVLRNGTNLGFVKAANQGIKYSDAKFVCLLNNDTIVAKSWLEEMEAIACKSDKIGIVNPSSNNLGQRPSQGEPLEHYAEKLRHLKGQYVELGSAIGFCMLIKREVIEKIGLLDEIYEMGNFEDTDYCRRAVKEGFTCVRACGAYVYHRENTSFNKFKTFDEDFKRNRETFEFRWGKPKRIAYVMDEYDANSIKSIECDSIKLARNGNWVWYFLKDEMNIPRHSNIIGSRLNDKGFHVQAAFRILKKKKRFDEIYVGDKRFGSVLEKLAFIHKAHVKYY